MTESPRTVVLLIDYDNLQICYSRDAPGTQLDLGAVMSLAQTYGRVVVARAYAEWNLLSERLQVYKVGMEPAFAPVMRPEGSIREGKSLADTVMVADGVDLLWTHRPDVLVLVTSDKDMIPLARLAKQRGTLLVVLGSDLTAVPLIEMANDFVTYRHLVRELGRSEEALPSGRLREDSRLRRIQEPVGHREVAAAREASLREPRTIPPRRPRSEPMNRPAFNPPFNAAPVAPPPMPAPAAQVPAPSAAVPEAVSLAVSALANRPFGGEDAQFDESLQALGPRRRRRRGGRGRRGPLGEGEGPAEPFDDALDGPEELDQQVAAAVAVVDPPPVLDEPRPAPPISYGAFTPTLVEEPIDEPTTDLLELPPGPRGLRRRRRAPRPETLAAIEPVLEAVPDPVEAEAPAEPTTLRPWERWPESRPESTPRRSATRSPAAVPSPATDEAPVNGTNVDAVIEAPPEPELTTATLATETTEVSPAVAAVDASVATEPTASVAVAEPVAEAALPVDAPTATEPAEPVTVSEQAAVVTDVESPVEISPAESVAGTISAEVTPTVDLVSTAEPSTATESVDDASPVDAEAKPVRPRRRRVRRTPTASEGGEAPTDGEAQA